MMALLLLARIGIPLLLTDKWAPTIPYFQLLCVAGLLYPISVVHSNVFKATGRSGLLLRLDSAKKALILMSIMATHTWGIAAMLWGHIAVSGIGYLLTSYYMGRMLRYPMLSQARAVLPYLLTSLVAAAIVAGLEHMPFHSDALLILLCIATGGAVYCAFNWMCRTAAWIEMVGILAPRLFPRGITGPA
jgi:O-antigen/teichoic acid export membrane protein